VRVEGDVVQLFTGESDAVEVWLAEEGEHVQPQLVR
jgi:hypothetical protein